MTSVLGLSINEYYISEMASTAHLVDDAIGAREKKLPEKFCFIKIWL